MFPRQVLFAACLAAAGSLWFGGTALAHIDPDPPEAPAGSQQSVGFTVEHGCGGSPTTQLDLRIPEGSSSVTPEPPAGWAASTADNVVTFTGGPLPDDAQLTFRVALVLPSSPGTTIYFPFVQRCHEGEIRWIDVPQDGVTEELDEPAPAMVLTAAVPGTTTASPAPEVSSSIPAESASPVTTAVPNPTAATTTVSAVEASDLATAPGSAASPGQGETSSEPARPTITAAPKADPNVGRGVLIGTVLVIAAGGGLMIRQARRSR